jgi:exonuclease III
MEDLLYSKVLTNLLKEDILLKCELKSIGFHEEQINFLPSYKFHKDQYTYSLTKEDGTPRLPGYADRIIFHNKSHDYTISDYKILPHILGSDHRPIICCIEKSTATGPIRCGLITWNIGNNTSNIFIETYFPSLIESFKNPEIESFENPDYIFINLQEGNASVLKQLESIKSGDKTINNYSIIDYYSALSHPEFKLITILLKKNVEKQKGGLGLDTIRELAYKLKGPLDPNKLLSKSNEPIIYKFPNDEFIKSYIYDYLHTKGILLLSLNLDKIKINIVNIHLPFGEIPFEIYKKYLTDLHEVLNNLNRSENKLTIIMGDLNSRSTALLDNDGKNLLKEYINIGIITKNSHIIMNKHKTIQKIPSIITEDNVKTYENTLNIVLEKYLSHYKSMSLLKPMSERTMILSEGMKNSSTVDGGISNKRKSTKRKSRKIKKRKTYKKSKRKMNKLRKMNKTKRKMKKFRKSKY